MRIVGNQIKSNGFHRVSRSHNLYLFYTWQMDIATRASG